MRLGDITIEAEGVWLGHEMNAGDVHPIHLEVKELLDLSRAENSDGGAGQTSSFLVDLALLVLLVLRLLLFQVVISTWACIRSVSHGVVHVGAVDSGVRVIGGSRGVVGDFLNWGEGMTALGGRYFAFEFVFEFWRDDRGWETCL